MMVYVVMANLNIFLSPSSCKQIISK